MSGHTERYSSAFGSDEVTGTLPLDITEAGIYTASSDGVLMLRVTSDAMEIDDGRTITVSTNVSHQNGTEA